MRPRVVALVVLAVVLALAGALARRRHLDARRLTEQRAAAARAHALAATLDRCLFGDDAVDDRALGPRARRVALHHDTGAAWPGACATHTLALVDTVRRAPSPPSALTRVADRAMAVTRALSDNALLTAVKGFREGTTDVDAFTWTPLVAALRSADRSLAAAYGLGPARSDRTPAPRALVSVAGEVVPVSVAPGSIVAGVSAAAGTLSVLFIEPGHERVFCRTRDRGVTVACKRLRGDAAPRYLLSNDDAEALLLRGDASATVASADALDAPVFTVGAPLVPSLAAHASGGTLYAVADVAGATTLARCPRGAPCVRFPLGVPASREAAVVSLAGSRWWLGVAGPDASQTLIARRLEPDAPPAEPVMVTALTSGATLLTSCRADGVAYVAVSDGGRTHLVAFEADAAPRLLGTLLGIGVPAEVVCDAAGAALVGAILMGACERRGGCAEPLTLEGHRRVARVGGELVVLSTTRDGGDGLRARHGALGEVTRARAWAVDDDAAHGGVSARDHWLFTAGDHLVLFATGATTVVLWSGDRGERWQASREPIDARPMRLGVVR